MTEPEEQENQDPQLIETIFYELDQSSFALALIGGAIIGAFVLYLFLQREKTLAAIKPVIQEVVEEPEPEIIEEVIIPADGGWNWELQQEQQAVVEQPGFGLNI